MRERYRIDRAYESIYQWDYIRGCYLFLCSFLQVGARPNNRDKTIIKKVKIWKDKEINGDAI